MHYFPKGQSKSGKRNIETKWAKELYGTMGDCFSRTGEEEKKKEKKKEKRKNSLLPWDLLLHEA